LSIFQNVNPNDGLKHSQIRILCHITEHKLCDCVAANTANVKNNKSLRSCNGDYDLRRSQLKPCCPRTKCTKHFGCTVKWNVSDTYQKVIYLPRTHINVPLIMSFY